jgi:type IV pilus assembly protein PilA
MSWFSQRINNKDEGFTLVELMVVVLIIAILIAIAIPTFLGARERAQDRAAQSNLRNALTAAKVHYTDTENYTGVGGVGAAALIVDLAAIEPSLTFVAAVAVTGDVGVEAPIANDQTVNFWAMSGSGTFFGICDAAINAVGPPVVTAGTNYSTGAAAANVDGYADCALASW